MTTLELEQIIRAQEPVARALSSVGENIIKNGRSYHELDTNEIKAALRHIITTSESEEEIKRRVKEEFHCPYEPSINPLTALTAAAGEAKMLCQAMGGLTMNNGTLVQLMVWGPDGEAIMM